MFKAIKSCRICKNTNLVKVLDLGEQFLTGVFPKNEDQEISYGPLQLLKCHNDLPNTNVCGLLQIAHDYDLNEMYGDNYGYRSGLNLSMVTHLKKKVEKLCNITTLSDNDLVIDIGSNDGTTLRSYPNQKMKLIGIDPTGKKFSKFYPKNIKLISDFFSQKIFNKHFGDNKAKVITSFSMFYDLDSPLEFMVDIKNILTEDGIWIFEQSYMPTMLETNSYDTVCHEHKEYYGLHQIKWMTDKIGLKIIDVEFNEVNGGSFSVTVAHENSEYKTYKLLDKLIENEKNKLLNKLQPYLDFSERIKKLRYDFTSFLEKSISEGKKIGALGASTKGNVILQYCNVNKKQIEFVGEVNSDKYNHFTPGTLIPIIPEEILLKKKLDYLIVLPWHFKNFFINNLKFKNTKLIFPLPNLEI